jgi:peptide chain release factor 1
MALFEQFRLELEQLSVELISPSIDNVRRIEAQKRAAYLSEALALHDRITQMRAELLQARQQCELEADPELQSLFKEEIALLEPQLVVLENELDDTLYPSDEHDQRSVFVEIRAGAGGQEAALFAADLYAAYQLYALSRGWQITVEDVSDTDLGGYKEIILFIKGRDAYKHLKFESGVHRVQRVPATETQGRVHTSTVTVAVLPEADEVDVALNMNDVRIDTYRSGGAGGQHVNKTDSAVRMTHIPTGIVVQCQDERSQIKNRAKAIKMLMARLLDKSKAEKAEKEAANRKQQVGGGERSEKIRTYNYPQNRVTDHRIGLTLKKLDYVMQGALHEIIDALVDEARRNRKAQ